MIAREGALRPGAGAGAGGVSPLTPVQHRYLLVETAVGAAINGVLSIVFAILVFAGQPMVSVSALATDTLPQSFMIALMATAVPTALTRRRVAAGAIPARTGPTTRLPRRVVLRALAVAIVVAGVATIVAKVALPLMLPTYVPFAAGLAGKAVYGTLLGAGVTWLAARAALADPVARAID